MRIGCLDSLFRTGYQDREILVLDNGSDDDPLVNIEEHYDERIRYQESAPECLRIFGQEGPNV
jgi:glycosyltransferase involved in cell wall biosynthesis